MANKMRPTKTTVEVAKGLLVGATEPEPAQEDYIEGLKVATQFDEIKKAKHYNVHPSGIECIEVVRHHNFNIGNAIKYVWRAGLKDEGVEGTLKDLKKAAYYIQDEIKRLESLDAAKEDAREKYQQEPSKGHSP